MPDLFFLIVGILLSLLGILCFSGAIQNNKACSLSVTAKVIGMEKDEHSYWRGTYRYFPTFSYTVNGKEYVIKDEFSATRSKSKYRVGGEIIIKCDPENPEEIKVGVKLSPYIIGIVFAAIGVLLIVCYFL